MASLDSLVMQMTARLVVDEPGEVRVEAPTFHVWAEGGVHELVCFSRTDAKERMRYGFTVCEDPNCDWCNDA